ncbi:MAG: hypothetical protein J3R72DRAFT_494591 [Linnemannia gamsii]|nr:MAG: hypothetical protein J3R72DRAFT_494591 [Linnemannia gamsii]
MTSTCASSEMAASFEDLSSLCSDKDIGSLILATTYDDDDLCASNNNNNNNNNNNKSHKSSNETTSKGENNDKAESIDNTSEESGTAEKAEGEEEVDDMEDYDFVNLVLDGEEDEADGFSEGWESSRSASPEPQQGDQRVLTSLPDAQSLENFQGHSSLPQTILQEVIYTSNSKEGSPAAESTEPNSNTASMIPKLRMTRDIYAALKNLALPSSSTSTPIPSVLLPQPAQSPAPQRIVATPSRFRLIRTQPPSSTVASFIPTPDNGSSSSPYQGKKGSPELKKAIRVTAYPCILRPINTTTTTTVTKANDVLMMTPPLAAAPEQVQVQVDGQKESMDVCKAIRRSTGERCTRLGRHTGYCQTHSLVVPK